ncbi:MqnA/MqnD/SBP family protein [Oscillospiraceae bacterium MB08-C2-2]|nr:MqnA/MqnD/SBP family protein [Oscillospiraceae bacterium MB08-C2-2]
MKKLLSLALVLMLAVSMLAGCTPNQSGETSESLPSAGASPTSSEAAPAEVSEEASEEAAAPTDATPPEEIRVSALKGPTAMGMVKLMQDTEDKAVTSPYTFAIGTTDEIVPKLSKGEIDIAAVPANLASVLYNNTEGKVQVLAINTLGVLYVVEKGDTVKSVADLKGKTIYATGKGATPEFALNYVLLQNGIDPTKDVTIEYKSEAAEIIPLMAQAENAIAIMPQPFVTVAGGKIPGLRVALDWTKEWDAVSAGKSSMVTGVVVVRKEFAETYPGAVAQFMTDYCASTSYTQTNVAEAAALVGKYGIVDAAVAEKALPACNITFIDGASMQEKLSGYLTVLSEQNPQSVGGKLPDEGFYYLP